MEKQLSFVAKLSLEEMALRKSVTLFWSDTDVLSLIEEFPFKSPRPLKAKKWREIQDKVKVRISKLVVPEQLKRRMDLVVRPIGLQIPEWREYMKRYLCPSDESLDMHLLKQLCWTSNGAIDHEKTAEKLASLETFDVVKRFKIASGYCLVDFLPLLWEELPEKYKSRFSATNHELWSLDDEMKLESYWAFILKGGECNVFATQIEFHRHLFQFAASTGCKAATKYFFQKSLSEELNCSRDSFILAALHSEGRIGLCFAEESSYVFCYLMSLLSPESQMRVIGERPGYLIDHFLKWPWHDLFLDNTNLIWNLPPDVGRYADLTRHISAKLQWSGYYFPNLFQEFFRRSPSDFRKYYVDQECEYGFVFSPFLQYEDKETVQVILRNIDYEDRVRLLSFRCVFNFLNRLLIERDRHPLVELCVREACLEKEDRERLKEVYMGYITEVRSKVIPHPLIIVRWQSIFECLDKTPASGLGKRSSEDDTVTPAKRQH